MKDVILCVHGDFWLKLQIPEFLYEVIRIEVQREIQGEWFAGLERQYYHNFLK